MPIRCFLAETKEDRRNPGAMWFDTTNPEVWKIEIESGNRVSDISDEYKRDWLGKRSPLLVRLPNGSEFCLDWWATGAGKSGWTITGEAPNITARPSINYRPGDPGGWHGWLTNGQLSDDLEGRTYT